MLCFPFSLFFIANIGSIAILLAQHIKRVIISLRKAFKNAVYNYISFFKAILGFGQVFKYTQNNTSYGLYVVQDQLNCKRLAYIFNGNLVLEKTNIRFQFWLKTLNIQPLKKKGILQLDNPGLSGFIDAEGCFSAKLRKDSDYKLNFRVERRFIINQKGELPIFSSLKILFKSNAKIQKIIQKNKTYYKLELKSMQSTQLLLNYLEKFPWRKKYYGYPLSTYKWLYGT